MYYNIKDAAKYLDISISTLRRWDNEGILKPDRTEGKHRRYNKKDLDKIKYKELINKSNIGYLDLQELLNIYKEHIIINGLSGTGKTRLAKDIFKKHINLNKIGLCITERNTWDDVLDINKHQVFNLDVDLFELNYFLIPNNMDKHSWIIFLTNAFVSSLNLNKRCEFALIDALYDTYEISNWNGYQLLSITLEHLLKRNISYEDSRLLIDKLKEIANTDFSKKISIENLIDINKNIILKINNHDQSSSFLYHLLISYYSKMTCNEKISDRFIIHDALYFTDPLDFSHIWNQGRAYNIQMILTTYNLTNVHEKILANCKLIISKKNHIIFNDILHSMFTNIDIKNKIPLILENLELEESLINFNSWQLQKEERELWILKQETPIV